MTKKEIVKRISEDLGLTQLKVKEIVQRVFDSIIDTLIEEERIELRNFGVFEVKKRAARTARNPRTGDPVSVPAKYVVTFKPGKTMEERVLELERRKLQQEQNAEQNAEQNTEQITTQDAAQSPATQTEPNTAQSTDPVDPNSDQRRSTQPHTPQPPDTHGPPHTRGETDRPADPT